MHHHTTQDAVEWKEYRHGPITFRRKELSTAADGDGLGCSLYELPPGKRSWPYHYHTANEEALYVLEGEGLVRTDDGEQPLRTGDYVALPANEAGAHQVVNDSDGDLRYLAVSTMNEPDVTIYPEMGKFGVYVGSPPGGRDDRPFHGYFPFDAATDYWEEEPDTA